LATRHRKVRKRRGSRTHGWGQIGQHRKTGGKGGHGAAGRHKHKWTWVLRYQPDYFGKKGFYRPNRREIQAVNLLQLSTIAERLEREGGERKKGRLVVNLAAMGIGKLVAGGGLRKPLLVVVDRWTETAAERVKEAGGEIVKPGQLKGEGG